MKPKCVRQGRWKVARGEVVGANSIKLLDIRGRSFIKRKEAFLPADHPLHARFARLTQQEGNTGCSMTPRQSEPRKDGNVG